MKLLLVFISVFLALPCFAQEKLKAFLGLSQNIGLNFTTTESNMNLGFNYDITDASFSVFGTYTYGGVIGFTNFTALHENFTPYQLDYHLLGGGVKLRIADRNKLYSPTFQLNLLTEFASRYQRGRLVPGIGDNDNEVYLSPTSMYFSAYKSNTNQNGEPVLINHFSYNYISTQFVGSFFIGNEFKVLNNLYLNVGFGYLFRIFKYYLTEWKPDEEEPKVEISQTHHLKEISGNFQFVFGINYLFSLKDKK